MMPPLLTGARENRLASSQVAAASGRPGPYLHSSRRRGGARPPRSAPLTAPHPVSGQPGQRKMRRFAGSPARKAGNCTLSGRNRHLRNGAVVRRQTPRLYRECKFGRFRLWLTANEVISTTSISHSGGGQNGVTRLAQWVWIIDKSVR
jgi:hypothetical protein